MNTINAQRSTLNVQRPMGRLITGHWSLVTLLILCSFVLGCSTVTPGNDPVVVTAERDTRLAADTFDLVVKAEKENRETLKAVNPQLAAALKTGTDKIRANAKQWLQSARSMTMTYKYNRTPANKANLQTALAVVTAGVTDAQKYLNQLNTATKNSQN